MATGFTENIWNNVLKDIDWKLTQLGAPLTFDGYETKRVETVDPGVWQYFADFVVSFGQRVAKPGASVFVNRLWANEVLIYDRTAGFASPAVVPTPTPPSYPPARTAIDLPPSAPPSPVPGEAPGLSGFTFFDGAEDQGEVFRGMHYRGLMVGRFLNFNLTDYGNRIPSITAELIDTEANDPANNVGGTIYYKNAAPTIIHEYHPEADANYRAYYRVSAVGMNMNVDKARLSTKTQSYEVNLKDTEYNGGETPSADFLRDLQMTFIPALNYAVGSFWDGATGLKVLHDLATANTLGYFPGYATGDNSDTSFTPWQGCIAFRVSEGSITHHLVFGATDVEYNDYPIGILVVRAGELKYAWGAFANTLEPTKCITVGKERSGSTDLYLTLGTKVEKLTVNAPGSTGYQLTLSVDRVDFYTASGGDVLQQAWFDPVRNNVIVLSTNAGVATLRALDTAGAVVWTSATFPAPNAKSLRARTQETLSNLSGGSLVISRDLTATTVTYVDLTNGDVDAVTIPDNGTNDYTLALNWDSGTNVLYSGANKYVAIGVLPDPETDPNRYTAAEVMRAYATFAGYDDADVATVGMDDLYIDGYVVSGVATLGGLANGLGTLYGFNWSEQSNVITFKNNYSAGSLTIDKTVDPDKLAKLANNSVDHFSVSRATDQDFPAVLSLSYFDGRNNYKPGYQVVRRNGEPMPTMGSDQRSDMSLPVTLDGDYALELLYGAMYRVWATKLSYSIRLPAEYMVMDAGDAIEFTADGMVYRAVITRNRVNVDNTVSLTLNETTDNTYPIQVPTQPTVQVPDKIPQPVRTVVLDFPDVNPAQTGSGTLNLHVLMAGYEPGKFRGGAFDITRANDPTGWVTRAAIGVDQEAFIGQLSEALGAWDFPFETDTYNAIVLEAGTIPAYKMVNATELELDAGANLIVVGEGSEVELVQFGVAEDIGGGLYRLSQLRRGRFGTEVFIVERPEGTTVSFLDNAQVVTYDYLEYEHDTQFLYRSYSPNQPKWQVDDYSIIPQGNSRKPYAPINIEAVRQPDGDIKITWTRRTRYANSPPADFNVPDLLDETQELYNVLVFAPIGTAYRTIETVTGEAIYAQAEQLFDGRTGTETTLPLTVMQMSINTVGAGLSAPLSIPIYDEGTARIRARFALGGAMETNVNLEYNPEVLLAMSFDGGGSMVANMLPTPVRIAADFAGGGEMLTRIAEPQYLAAAFDGGGAMTVDLLTTAILPHNAAFTLDTTISSYPLNGIELNNEPFTTDVGQFTLYTEGTIGTFAFSGGNGVFTMGSGTRSTIAVTGPDIEVPDMWVQADVISNGTNPTGYNNIGVGIAKDGNNFIYCSLDRRNNAIRIQVKIAGTNTFLGSIAHTLAFPSKIALSVVGNEVVAWTGTSGGVWTRRVTQNISSLVDLLTLDLTGWKASLTVATPNAAVWNFDNLVSSRFGAVGLRDITLVTNEDGTPVDFSGKYRFTASAAAPVGSHNAVYEFDPATDTIVQTGVIWTDRGGSLEADLAAHIVKNADTTWRYLVSTWGNGFGGDLDILHKNNVGDITSGTHVVDTMTALSLPLVPGGAAGGAYDPYLIKNGTDWLLGYAVTDDTDFSTDTFYLAAATSSDMVTWTAVDDAPTRNRVEGPKIVKAGGEPYIVGGGRGDQPVYNDLMVYQGNPTFSPDLYTGTETQPHVMMFPHGAEYIALTWNNVKFSSLTFTWGNLLVYRAPRV